MSPFDWSPASRAAKKYRTQCKICYAVILAGEATVWLTKPMGLSHKECAR